MKKNTFNAYSQGKDFLTPSSLKKILKEAKTLELLLVKNVISIVINTFSGLKETTDKGNQNDTWTKWKYRWMTKIIKRNQTNSVAKKYPNWNAQGWGGDQ